MMRISSDRRWAEKSWAETAPATSSRAAAATPRMKRWCMAIPFSLPHEARFDSHRAASCEAAPYIFVMFVAKDGSTALSGALGALGAELRTGLPFGPVTAVSQVLADLEHDLQVLKHAGVVPIGLPLIRRLVVAVGAIVGGLGLTRLDRRIDEIAGRRQIGHRHALLGQREVVRAEVDARCGPCIADKAASLRRRRRDHRLVQRRMTVARDAQFVHAAE